MLLITDKNDIEIVHVNMQRASLPSSIEDMNILIDTNTQKIYNITSKNLEEKITLTYQCKVIVNANGEVIDIESIMTKEQYELLNPIIEKDIPAQSEIDFAEYVLSIEDRLEILERGEK